MIFFSFVKRKHGWKHSDIRDNLEELQKSGIVKPVDGGYTRVVLHDKVRDYYNSTNIFQMHIMFTMNIHMGLI